MESPSGKKRLGEILLAAQLLEEGDLAEVLQEQAVRGGRLGSLLIRKGSVTEEDVLKCLSAQFEIASVDLGELEVSPSATALVSRDSALKHGIIPVGVDHDNSGRRRLTLAMADPTDLEVIATLEFELGLVVRPVVATESSILRAIERRYVWAEGTPTECYRLHGWAAIEYAEEFGGALYAYSWGPGQADAPLGCEDAKRVARAHPWRVYVNASLCESCLAEGKIRGAKLPKSSGMSVCRTYGAKRPIESWTEDPVASDSTGAVES